MENTLTFITEKRRRLHVQSFENYTSGSGMTEGCSIGLEDTEEEIYQKVIDLENQYRSRHFASKQRNVAYCYWATESEFMTDDREKFGHSNQTSSKETKVIVPNTYVRGEVITISEALAKSFNERFSDYVKATLSNFISIDLKLDRDNLKEEQLSMKIVMIEGEGKRETFFDHFFETTQMKIFPEEKLVILKE